MDIYIYIYIYLYINIYIYIYIYSCYLFKIRILQIIKCNILINNSIIQSHIYI